MLTTLAIANYRSLRNLIVPLRRLNLITGPNGSGKSSVYRALRFWIPTLICGPPLAKLETKGASKTSGSAPRPH